MHTITKASHNLIALYYDRELEFFGGLHEKRQALVDKLELKSGDQVLEVRVGTGANLPKVAR